MDPVFFSLFVHVLIYMVVGYSCSRAEREWVPFVVALCGDALVVIVFACVYGETLAMGVALGMVIGAFVGLLMYGVCTRHPWVP